MARPRRPFLRLHGEGAEARGGLGLDGVRQGSRII